MKKIRNTNSKILFALSLMFATSALGLISFGTMCAFQNKEQESFQYQTDIKPLSSYFDGGNGTSPENAYIISTEKTFINFQKLVQLGCFTYNTYFRLGANIDFSGDTTVLDPIGTENCPFNSQFDGMGHTLSKLKVSSVNHEDVGLFGYVGSGGYIKNIKLDTPSITSTGPSTKTANPLEGIVPSSSVEAPAYINETSINMESKPVNNYTVYYRSANKGILTDGGVLQTNNIKTNNKFAIHVDAIITTSILINNEPMVITYVADRFAVYIEGKKILSTDGVISLFDRTTVNGKLTTKDPHYYEDTVKTTNTDGTTTSTPRILDQVTFVGLVAGHLDGEAEYIGVYNGTITANSRQTISHSSLIGKHKDDDLLNSLANNYYYQDINFSEMIEKKPSLGNTGYVNIDPTKYDTYNSANDFSGQDRDYTNIFNNTQEGLEDIGIQIPDAFRIYSGFGVTPVNDIGAYEEIVNEDTGNTEKIYHEMEGIYFNSDIEQAMGYKTSKYGLFYPRTDITTLKYFSLNNCLCLWTLREYLSNSNKWYGQILDSLLGNTNTPVYLTIKLTYSVPNCVSAKDTAFKLYMAALANNPVPPDRITGHIDKATIPQIGDSDNSYIDRTTDPSKWQFTDVTNQIADVSYIDENGIEQIEPFNKLLCSGDTNNSNIIQSKSISIQTNSQTMVSWFGKSVTYSPMFALGLEGISGTKTQMDLYRAEVLISYDQGNFSYSLNKVDFLYDIINAKYTEGAGWTGWAKKESGVKIYFILQDFDPENTNDSLSNGVVITYTRSSGYGYKVTATYTVLGDDSYKPSNTSGAQAATITDGRQ